MAPTKNTPNARVIGLAVAGAVGGFLFGFDSSVVNGAVNPIAAQFHLSKGISLEETGGTKREQVGGTIASASTSKSTSKSAEPRPLS